MKNTLKLFVLVAFVFAAFAASAQTAKPIKLGHLDTDKLMSVMPETKSAREAMAAKQADIEKELQSMYTSYQKLMDEYKANVKTYNEVTRTAKEQEIQSLEERIQRFRDAAQGQMEKMNQELLQPIIDKIQAAIQAVGKANGYTYIFAQGALLFVSDTSEDVLPLVKKQLGIQ